VYRPDAQAVRRCEDALAAMDAAWQQAQAMLTDVLAMQSA